MRKLILFIGIVFLLGSCNTGNMNTETNPFIGTWETTADTFGQVPKKMVFTDDEVTSYDENGEIFSTHYPILITWNGPYEYTDTVLKIFFNGAESLVSLSIDYEFKNSGLYLQGCPYTKK